ncbi:unnamed protein product [Vitrella brassicaformis CCMP3155]|uniref:VWFA domain-containing protein n=1 Tax=Vitrella brassicaformis (strain CCMP3155) TaxID=1169540 RepID=A0A0G4GX06_VITBC|nr:unnamed protein product [Vitrella brassicaformis CCMP3155]|eukprot:CEM35380.1 unnamed protein product [Vitrella brassicaformis CCMP3155]
MCASSSPELTWLKVFCFGFFLVLRGAAGQSVASPSCPCLDQPLVAAALAPFSKDGGYEYQTYRYPGDYGVSCATHDRLLPPFCANAEGAVRSDAPTWCHDEWCWIDDNDCTLPLKYRSAYFPSSGLHFSYQTCGSTNGSWQRWFNESAADLRPIDELATVVENYIFSIRNTIEGTLADIDGGGVCSVTSCSCPTCSQIMGSAWGSQSLDLTATVFKDGSGSAVSQQSRCMSNVASSVFLRIAGSEYDSTSRLGYLYGGFQTDGAYVQWPRMDCSELTFDPRYRPWYASASTGPKNVVIVVDRSGSMSQQNRMWLARLAVKSVIDTLTWKDNAALIAFNDRVGGFTSAGNGLIPMTGDNKASMKSYADGLVAIGGTDFRLPLDRAMQILSTAGTEGGCINAVLFMTDGEAPFSDADFSDIKQRASAKGAAIFSYAFGSGAASYVPRRLACENQGVFHQVADGGDLSNAMSSYYTYFAAGTGYRGARWILYSDAVTGTDLLAACTPTYDPREAGSELSSLVGVMCVDVNVIVSLDVLRLRSDYSAFISRVEADTVQCTPLFQGLSGSLKESALEKVRQRLASAGASSCEGFLDDTDDDGGGAGDAISAAVAIPIVVVVTLGGMGWFYRRHRRRKQNQVCHMMNAPVHQPHPPIQPAAQQYGAPGVIVMQQPPLQPAPVHQQPMVVTTFQPQPQTPPQPQLIVQMGEPQAQIPSPIQNYAADTSARPPAY